MPLGSLFGGNIPDDVMAQATDDKELVKVEAMIQSMTRKERAKPDLFLKDDPKAERGAAKYTRGRKKKKPPKPTDPAKSGRRACRTCRASPRSGPRAREPLPRRDRCPWRPARRGFR